MATREIQNLEKELEKDCHLLFKHVLGLFEEVIQLLGQLTETAVRVLMKMIELIWEDIQKIWKEGMPDLKQFIHEIERIWKAIQTIGKESQSKEGEIEKKIQSIWKEIEHTLNEILELFEKVIQRIDNGVTSLEIRNEIRRALQKHLERPHPGEPTPEDSAMPQEFTYKVISYTDSEDAETDGNNFRGRIELVRDQSIRVIPDTEQNNEHMIYNKLPLRIYTVFVCTSTKTDDIRFLYEWKKESQINVIAPYFVLPDKEDSDILCSYTLDVTKAAKSGDSVKALEKALEQLANRSNKEKGFNQDMYGWDIGGSEENFTVQMPQTEKEEGKYWKVEGTELKEKGNMVLTTKIAKQEHLRFVVTSVPQTYRRTFVPQT